MEKIKHTSITRIIGGSDATISTFEINGKPQTFMIEDEHRTVKVWGETRIPEGEYFIALRNEGSINARYAKKYGKKHFGMITIYNNDNWVIEQGQVKMQYCMLHIGNTDDDTAGCPLPNFAANIKTMSGTLSTQAYWHIYNQLAPVLKKVGKLPLTIRSIEKNFSPL